MLEKNPNNVKRIRQKDSYEGVGATIDCIMELD